MQNYIKNKFILVLLVYPIVFLGQISIGTPSLGFSQACASTGFNSYNLNFSFAPVSNLGSGNQFVIELSDGNGNFTTPTILTTSNATTSPVAINFSFPTTLNGSAYKIRVRSTNPVSMSPSSVSFSGNYAPYNQPFTINNNISNQVVCNATNYTLQIDSGTNSPLNNSALTYKWYKNNVEISGQTGSSLSVTEAATYYVKVNYGTCTSNAQSNSVTISFTTGSNLSISSTGNQTSICPSTGLLLSSSITGSGNTYQWYKDNVVITGATNSTYNATIAGEYKLKVNTGICELFSNNLTLTSQDITATLSSGATTTLLPGQNLLISCSTNASNATYLWYKNNTLLNGQTSSSLNINDIGTYKVVVKQNSSCVITKEVSTVIVFPSSYNLVIANSSSYVSCENTTESLQITSFTATTTNGLVNILTSSIPILYKWSKNNTPINTAINSSYTISSNNENGDYTLKITLSNGTVVTSNVVNVKLKFDPTINLTSSGFICDSNPTVTISSSINNTSYSYKWFKEGNSTVLSTTPTCSVINTGNYYVEISNLGCSKTSPLIGIQSLDNSVITSNYDENIQLNSGEEIDIIVSSADSYQWYLNDVLVSTSATYHVDSDVELELRATKSGCILTKYFTVVYNTQFFNTVIPNTITPNNDGKNDTWIITEEYAYKDDVEIVIFSSDNTILFKTFNYQNNWPIEPIQGRNKIFYYKILKNNVMKQQGTITVVK